jgi:predicted DNA-binding transcriptional regulator YafY
VSDKSQSTGSQRLVHLYRLLAQGYSVSPVEYAGELGIERQSVYYQLGLLKEMGFPIVNTERGEWAFGTWEDISFDLLSIALGNTHRTAAQRLVTLYQDLVRGKDISPTAYAKENGVKRQTVYRQLDLLSQAGFPVTNMGNKGWTLMEYMEYLYD